MNRGGMGKWGPELVRDKIWEEEWIWGFWSCLDIRNVWVESGWTKLWTSLRWEGERIEAGNIRGDLTEPEGVQCKINKAEQFEGDVHGKRVVNGLHEWNEWCCECIRDDRGYFQRKIMREKTPTRWQFLLHWIRQVKSHFARSKMKAAKQTILKNSQYKCHNKKHSQITFFQQ